MHKGRVAEWVVSLVTSSERASALVGDLEERRSGLFEFWCGVVRTTGSLLWHSFTSDWPRMLALGALGILLETLLIAAGAILIAFATFALTGLLGGVLPGESVSPPQMLVSQRVAQWIGSGAGFVISLWAQFSAGRVIARRAPGRELAPCIGVLLLEYALAFVLYLIWPSGMSETVLGIAMGVLSDISLFAGAASVRRRRLAA
jgi:hypothetical protein